MSRNVIMNSITALAGVFHGRGGAVYQELWAMR